MLLNLEQAGVPMKMVYQLSQEMKDDPDLVPDVQKLTLNKSDPHGLKGSHGLYGSEEWWKNIEEREMPLLFISGVIVDAYRTGQDCYVNGTLDLKLDDGSIHTIDAYYNRKKDFKFFKIGHRVDFVQVFDEMKEQPAEDGGINYSEIMLEMAVSLEAVE